MEIISGFIFSFVWKVKILFIASHCPASLGAFTWPIAGQTWLVGLGSCVSPPQTQGWRWESEFSNDDQVLFIQEMEVDAEGCTGDVLSTKGP